MQNIRSTQIDRKPCSRKGHEMFNAEISCGPVLEGNNSQSCMKLPSRCERFSLLASNDCIFPHGRLPLVDEVTNYSKPTRRQDILQEIGILFIEISKFKTNEHARCKKSKTPRVIMSCHLRELVSSKDTRCVSIVNMQATHFHTGNTLSTVIVE